MNLNDYDNIKIPEQLNDYIDKGTKKGIAYEKENKNKGGMIKKAASIVAISTISLTAASNIPVFANELVKVPLIGKLVRTLDFTNSIEFGGVITDGNNIVIDSLKKDTINIYFSEDNELVRSSPHYEIEYRQYPYTLVLTFSGVRGLYNSLIEEKVKDLPFVKDVYNIIVLDDSTRKFAIEFNENLSFKVTEHENPGMIQIKAKDIKKENINKKSYFIRTKEFEYGEALGMVDEQLFEYKDRGIQKTKNGKYIVQLGPYESKEEADKKLKELTKNQIPIDVYIENRDLGQGPK